MSDSKAFGGTAVDVESPFSPVIDRLQRVPIRDERKHVGFEELTPRFSDVRDAVLRWANEPWRLQRVPAFTEESHQHPPPPSWIVAAPQSNRGFAYNGGITVPEGAPFVLAYLRWRTRVTFPAPALVMSRLYYRFRLNGRFRADCGGQLVSLGQSANIGVSANNATSSPFDDPKFPVWRRFGVEAEHSGGAPGAAYRIADSGNAVFEGSLLVRPGSTPALALRLNADMFLSKSWVNYQYGGPNEVWVSTADGGDGYVEYRYVPYTPGPWLSAAGIDGFDVAVEEHGDGDG